MVHIWTAAADLHGSILAQQLRCALDDMSEKICDRMDNLSESVSKGVHDDDSLTEAGMVIATSLQSIAEMLDMYSCGRPVNPGHDTE